MLDSKPASRNSRIHSVREKFPRCASRARHAFPRGYHAAISRNRFDRSCPSVGIYRPHQIAKAATVIAVMSAVLGLRDKGLSHAVRHKQRDASRATMPVRSADRSLEVLDARHVRDRVVDKHRIERAPEVHRAHVAHAMLAFGLSLRLTATICADRSTSVISNLDLRYSALLPPPEPSRGPCAALAARLSQHARKVRRLLRVVPGAEKSGHHSASSSYSFIALTLLRDSWGGHFPSSVTSCPSRIRDAARARSFHASATVRSRRTAP